MRQGGVKNPKKMQTLFMDGPLWPGQHVVFVRMNQMSCIWAFFGPRCRLKYWGFCLAHRYVFPSSRCNYRWNIGEIMPLSNFRATIAPLNTNAPDEQSSSENRPQYSSSPTAHCKRLLWFFPHIWKGIFEPMTLF